MEIFFSLFLSFAGTKQRPTFGRSFFLSHPYKFNDPVGHLFRGFMVILLPHSSTFLTDFLSLDDDDAPQKRDRESDCLCQNSGPDSRSCICCLEFNVSETFDLGPACVRLKYLSQTEGVAMNLTLGKTLTKSSVIAPTKPNADKSVCLSMLGGLAKMCSKITGLVPSANGGLVGCLSMQPKLFGEVPINFEFPCFDLNSNEIRVIETPKKTEDEVKDDDETETETPTNSTSDETIGGFKVEDILNVVSKTADQGIKIISELFGVGDDSESDEAPAAVESKTLPEKSSNATKST